MIWRKLNPCYRVENQKEGEFDCCCAVFSLKAKMFFFSIFCLNRHHPLIKHADILTCIETRISMLSMTYTKFIDMSLCCFIPGKIIDEVLNILRLVSNTTGSCRQLRAHEVLQELRDISSMAIDHFDEKIAHILKKSFCDLSAQKFGSSIYQSKLI